MLNKMSSKITAVPKDPSISGVSHTNDLTSCHISSSLLPLQE